MAPAKIVGSVPDIKKRQKQGKKFTKHFKAQLEQIDRVARKLSHQAEVEKPLTQQPFTVLAGIRGMDNDS